MSTETLTFRTDDKWSVVWFESPGSPCVIQIRQKEPGDVDIYAGVDGMQPTRIGHIGNHMVPDVIFELDVCEGLMVLIRSFGEVECAKMVSPD